MILITGASGFIGGALVTKLLSSGREKEVALAGRKGTAAKFKGVRTDLIDNIGKETNWHKALRDVDTVVHCAAHVHSDNRNNMKGQNLFSKVNFEGTATLAKQAAYNGVKRFIFVSSIKVNGENTHSVGPFSADDEPFPNGLYSISKYEAERELRGISETTGMEYVIIRPPLVYGPGVKANFQKLTKLISLGIPLPLGSITENKRSFSSINNLTSLIVTCLNHPNARNRTFLVSDDQSVSTVKLLQKIGVSINQQPRLIYVPPRILKFNASIINRNDLYEKLCGSLEVNIQETKQILNWNPPETLDQGLKNMADALKI